MDVLWVPLPQFCLTDSHRRLPQERLISVYMKPGLQEPGGGWGDRSCRTLPLTEPLVVVVVVFVFCSFSSMHYVTVLGGGQVGAVAFPKREWSSGFIIFLEMP